ncbi:MAG: exonuclease domain-containing protein [Clostridiales bacterium]|nr:exonuclease domain-containing protein [Candidatus Blautia equi]
MNYIVFDLEWNQSPYGKKQSNKKLPFEIIEIGAVKMNEKKEIEDTFHRIIKPRVYKWIHECIREVTHFSYKELSKGMPFEQAVQEFLEWCGPEFYFFSWGDQDVMELQRNMKYYHLLDLLPGPVIYYDVQKLFGIRFENRKSRRALEYAVDMLMIPKRKHFHRALEDAEYTAEVLRCIESENILPNSSIDVYQNPKSRKDEIFIAYPTYDKYVSREFEDREHMMHDREVTSTRCPVCGKNARRKLRWFLHNSKNYYSVSVCQEHGLVKGKIRVKKTEEEQYFSVKTIKLITEEEALEIREKREAVRRKRQEKKKDEAKKRNAE